MPRNTRPPQPTAGTATGRYQATYNPLPTEQGNAILNRNWEEYPFNLAEEAPAPRHTYRIDTNGIRGIEQANRYTPADNRAQNTDIFGIDDNTGTPDWRPTNLSKTKQKQTIKEVTISKEALEAIETIHNLIVNEYVKILENTYVQRLDLLLKKEYNNLIESVNADYDNYTHSNALHNLKVAISDYNNIISKQAIFTDGSTYFEKLEDIAQQKYNKEHSIYQFYPRLKAKVNYGNPELLSEILSVTQIGRGKVICR